ncbi:MAG: tetratricopeptide repeat protein [Gammaproteobacteria bacterium]
MSLLLSSLKKADEQNQNPAQPADASVAAATPASGAPAPAAQAGASIDFDNVAAGASDGDDTKVEEERRELVSATRVFRAGEDGGESGGGSRALIGVLALLVVVGGGVGAVFSGLIPGVSPGSIMSLLGQSAPVAPVAVKTDTGPVLAAASSSDEASLLPRPIVDVQSGIVEFAGFRGSDSALDTPQSRRELVAQIQGFVEEAAEDDSFFEEEEDLGILGLEIDGEVVEPEEEIELEQAIKTAALSRDRKFSLDKSTPSDIVILDGVKNNASVEIVIAQSSDSEIAGDAADSETADAAAETAEAEAIQVKPSLDGVDRRRMLSEAGRLYVGGEYAEAEAVYRNVLSANATNIDALRGLALVAVATGRYQLAVATYLKILGYYPNDPVAIADLTNLHGVSADNFYAIESALKKVLGDRPEWDSRLHFALGNLYAGEERWADAQKSYFNAYSGEQTNPDYAYNLAVVLDYLNKPGLAATYYREALALSEHAPSGFNAGQVRARIADISQ